MNKIVSLQYSLVDRMPRQVKDLRPRRSVTTSREDCGSTTSPESGSESLLHDDGDTESDRSPKEKAGEEADPPLFLSMRRSTRRKRSPPGYHFCDQAISGEIVLQNYLEDIRKLECRSLNLRIRRANCERGGPFMHRH